MKSNNFYNISSEAEFFRKINYIKFNVEDFTNSDNGKVNTYYYYLLLKNFKLKLQCKNSKLKFKLITSIGSFLYDFQQLYDFDLISKKYKISVNVYTLDLNDFKMFYSFK